MPIDTQNIFTPAAEDLLQRQLGEWPETAARYEALRHLQVRTVDVGGVSVRLQYNPSRIGSTASKVDAASLAARPCFLCDVNRPPEQLSLPIGDRYKLLVNPFPIFPRHFTLPALEHTPQRIEGRCGDMLQLAAMLPGYVVFYNGPHGGASAPDHMHFQAGNADFIPLLADWHRLCSEQGEVRILSEGVTVSRLHRRPAAMWLIEADKPELVQCCLARIISRLPCSDGEEPSFNLLCVCEEGRWRCWVVLRSRHRSSHYYSEGNDNRLVSPGAVDMAGVIITPRESDFLALTAEEISDIYRQVASPEEVEAVWQNLE